MGIFDYFLRKEKTSSASVAKERLQIVVAHERRKRNQPDYLPLLQQEILEVIRKYVDIDQDQISVQLDSNDDCSVLELNITLPD
ncbi:MAG TPA: cell division topological specificity factor MinE [Cellvibrionaceae bacterium]